MATPRPERFGRYEILLELGRGGMAELYLGRRSGVGGFEKLVAIKRILPHLIADPQFRELFLNEGRIAAQLSHPNVCQVYELDEADGELYLAMEYLDGVSWDTLIAAAPRGEIAMRLAVAVLAQACEGLHYAHTLRDATGSLTPVVHRDVSPQNLFVTIDGVCKVLDFGIAKMAKDGPRTRTGVLKGKLPYMAPEQIKGEPVDSRTDVFALGVCLWEALTGERLYDRDTDFLIWKAIAEEAVPSINAKVQRYPAGLDAVIGRALEKDKTLRYATALELAADLTRIVVPMTDAEVAGLVRSLCADRLARRQREIATVVSESRAASLELRAMTDPSAAATVDERGGMRAAATLEDPIPQHDEPAATVSMAMRGESLVMPRPPRRWPIALAALAAALTIVIVIVLASRGGAREPTEPLATPTPVTPATASVSLETAGMTIDTQGVKLDLRTPPDDGDAGDAKPKPKPVAKPAKPIKPRPEDRAKPRDVGVVGDRGATPPPAPTPIAPPVVATGSGSAVAAPAPLSPGTFSIDSDPYATVYVDGKAIGDTPLYVPIAAGKHAVRVVTKERGEKSFEITVPPGGNVNSGKLVW